MASLSRPLPNTIHSCNKKLALSNRHALSINRTMSSNIAMSSSSLPSSTYSASLLSSVYLQTSCPHPHPPPPPPCDLVDYCVLFYMFWTKIICVRQSHCFQSTRYMAVLLLVYAVSWLVYAVLHPAVSWFPAVPLLVCAAWTNRCWRTQHHTHLYCRGKSVELES